MGRKLNIGLTFAAVFGTAAGIMGLGNLVHPRKSGADYLIEHGYSNVEGGDPDFFNGCNKSEYSRKFVVTTASGSREERVVCFGPLGPHDPLYQ